ncbi:hypothetical protein K1719_004238 [Acacia pycnantha]|nr:hypothetical protein K1719_004238 [Acacia pycnantha]
MNVTLPQDNILIHSTAVSITCLAMAAAPDNVNSVLNVIANMQQQNHHVFYDVPFSLHPFRPVPFLPLAMLCSKFISALALNTAINSQPSLSASSFPAIRPLFIYHRHRPLICEAKICEALNFGINFFTCSSLLQIAVTNGSLARRRRPTHRPSPALLRNEYEDLNLEAKQLGTMEDLSRFVQRKDFYRKVGKAWKRGYLLLGTLGTGKSSLIGA